MSDTITTEADALRLTGEAMEGLLKLSQDRGLEIAQLKTKLAALEAQPPREVVLEKVASLDSNRIRTTVGRLVDTSLLQNGDREKIASQLMTDPNFALELIGRIIDVQHAPAHSDGQGIKLASITTPKTDALTKAAAEWEITL